MDRRINYMIGIDTETCNNSDKFSPLSDDTLVYDVGWMVTDRRGNVYRKRSFLVMEVFFGMYDAMCSAYYLKKVPDYLDDMRHGLRIALPFSKIREVFLQDMEEFGVETVFAHNARFDLKVLNNTIRYLTNSRCRYFFPADTVIWDTLKMARQTIGKQVSYKSWCIDNGFCTSNNAPKFSAEILYRYISGQKDFEESHTGLEDVEIEKAIMAHCIRQHKKMDARLFTND